MKTAMSILILITAILVGAFSMAGGEGFLSGFACGLIGAWLSSRLFLSFK